jgi:hypothetical protein
VRSMFSMNWNPRSRQDWLGILEPLYPKCKRMLWTYFAAQSWALWTTKNKFTIEGKFPRQPANRVFQFLINLQLWCHSKKTRDLGWWRNWRRCQELIRQHLQPVHPSCACVWWLGLCFLFQPARWVPKHYLYYLSLLGKPLWLSQNYILVVSLPQAA